MATRFACDARIQAVSGAASSKRAAQAVAAAPLNIRAAALRPMAPAFGPASVSRARNVAMRSVAPVEAGTPVDPNVGTPEWIACVANAEWFFNDAQNETIAEQLRELARYYEEIGRPRDFFFVSEPAWLDKFPEGKNVRRPAIALVSTDKQWMTFMKLRLDRVLKLDLGPMSLEDATKNTAAVPKFGPIKNWTAPYPPYAPGWWKPFMFLERDGFKSE